MQIEVGDLVLTPRGEMPVVQVDFKRDTFMTEAADGLTWTWRAKDVEPMSQPDLGSPEEVERWLQCVACVVPGLQVESRTMRCVTKCNCRYCYQITRTITFATDYAKPRVEVTHFFDAPACQCAHRSPGKPVTGRPCVCVS